MVNFNQFQADYPGWKISKDPSENAKTKNRKVKIEKEAHHLARFLKLCNIFSCQLLSLNPNIKNIIKTGKRYKYIDLTKYEIKKITKIDSSSKQAFANRNIKNFTVEIPPVEVHYNKTENFRFIKQNEEIEIKEDNPHDFLSAQDSSQDHLIDPSLDINLPISVKKNDPQNSLPSGWIDDVNSLAKDKSLTPEALDEKVFKQENFDEETKERNEEQNIVDYSTKSMSLSSLVNNEEDNWVEINSSSQTDFNPINQENSSNDSGNNSQDLYELIDQEKRKSETLHSKSLTENLTDIKKDPHTHTPDDLRSTNINSNEKLKGKEKLDESSKEILSKPLTAGNLLNEPEYEEAYKILEQIHEIETASHTGFYLEKLSEEEKTWLQSLVLKLNHLDHSAIRKEILTTGNPNIWNYIFSEKYAPSSNHPLRSVLFSYFNAKEELEFLKTFIAQYKDSIDPKPWKEIFHTFVQKHKDEWEKIHKNFMTFLLEAKKTSPQALSEINPEIFMDLIKVGQNRLDFWHAIYDGLSPAKRLHNLLYHFDHTETGKIIPIALEGCNIELVTKAFILMLKEGAAPPSFSPALRDLARNVVRQSPEIAAYLAQTDIGIDLIWQSQNFISRLHQIGSLYENNYLSKERGAYLLDKLGEGQDLKNVISLLIFHEGQLYLPSFKKEILIPHVSKLMEQAFESEKKFNLITTWMTRNLMTYLPEKFQVWQEKILNEGTEVECALWFKKLQQFYLQDRSPEIKASMLQFLQKLPTHKASLILRKMHPAIDKLVLESKNKKMSYIIYDFLTNRFDQSLPPGSQFAFLNRFRKFLSNAEKFYFEEKNLHASDIKIKVFSELDKLAKDEVEEEDHKTLKRVISDLKKERKVEKLNNSPYALRSHAVLQFFQKMDQKHTDNKEVLFPTYYHSTHSEALFGILNQKKIEYRWEQQHPGVWVSTKREDRFGNYCIVTTSAIDRFKKGWIRDMESQQVYWIAFNQDVELNISLESSHQKRKEFTELLNSARKDIAYISVPEDEVDEMQAFLDQKNLGIKVLSHSVSDRVNFLIRNYFNLKNKIY